jgi:membrane associated rhomboid family serine protease
MSNYQYYRPNRFPPVVKNLIIVNALIFVAQMTFGENQSSILNLFALHDIHSVYFQPHQLVTYMFLHGGVSHILFNMLALWMFGSLLENHWGAKRFIQFYFVCGIAAGLLHLVVLYFEMEPLMALFRQATVEEQLTVVRDSRWPINAPTVGASGAVFGCLAAFGYLFPNSLIYLYFMIPIKAKWFVIIYAGLELTLAIRNSAGDTVAHFAHLGGALAGFIMVYIWNKTNRKTLY